MTTGKTNATKKYGLLSIHILLKKKNTPKLIVIIYKIYLKHCKKQKCNLLCKYETIVNFRREIMNKYLSLKIKVISFIAIIMVVFLHCYNFQDNFLVSTTIITEGLNIATFVEYFLCNGLNRVAVPIFFMISGYLFFLSFKFTKYGYFSKIKSRFVSLAIPYILWSLISMGICLIFWGVDIMPVDSMKLNLESGGLLQVFLNPPNFQFWFILQLILYVIISPIIYLLIKFNPTRIVYLIGLFVMWFIDKGIPSIGGVTIVTEAIFFYSIGAYLAITNKKDIILKEKKNTQL